MVVTPLHLALTVRKTTGGAGAMAITSGRLKMVESANPNEVRLFLHSPVREAERRTFPHVFVYVLVYLDERFL